MARSRFRRWIKITALVLGLLVIGLVGLIGATILTSPDCGRTPDAAKITLNNISSALIMFKLDNGRYPTTEEGLAALIQAPANTKHSGKKYIESESVPLDPWDHPLLYFSPGGRPDCQFEVISLGSDGTPGGEYSNEDLHVCDRNHFAHPRNGRPN